MRYGYLQNNPPEECTQSIIRDAVTIEQDFVTDALPGSLIRMNSRAMSQQIDFAADRLPVSLDCSKIYNSLKTFCFMEMVSG